MMFLSNSFIVTFLVLSVAIFCISNVHGFEEEEGVLVLGSDDFDDAVAAHSQLLVEFYAPWCGHCKSLAPHWSAAAKTLKSSPVKLAKVDATEHKELAERFEIKGFPTIKYISEGTPSDYNGGRTEDEIVKWVNKKTGPAAATVSTTEELSSVQDLNEVFVIGVFSGVEAAGYKAFMKLAAEDDVHVYVVSTSTEVATKLAVESDTVVVLKTFDDLRADLSVAAGFDKTAVAAFIGENSTPLVQEFSQEASKKIFSSPIQKHVLFFTNKDAAYHAETYAIYSSVAAEFKGKALFINVPSTENKVAEYFGFSESDYPAMVIGDLQNESGGIKKFPYSGTNTVEGVKAFVTSFFNGELKATLKSEKPSPEDLAGNVKVLKGESFADVVLNNNKDVLVEFYAPWCGHCKNLAPVWDKLGDELAGNDNVVIAKMDYTANEVDVKGMSVKGFPTIYFFKGDDKSNPIKYEEGRELKDLLKFLGSNAHHPIDHDEL